MKLSPAAELAIRGMIVLADRYGQGPVTLNAICEVRSLPKQYLVKLFSSLAKADLVTPIRGKRGGYMMSRPPSEVTLLEVIEAVEGPIVLNLCLHVPPKCDRTDCVLRRMWAEMQEDIRTRLAGVSLSSCLDGAKGHRKAK